MVSTFSGLEIGKRALTAQQAALSMTGNNISNANTQGYTRQDSIFQPTLSIPYFIGNKGLALGTGVEVTQFRRMRESYLDSQYYTQQQSLGYWQEKQSALSNVEVMFNEPSDSGLQSKLDNFFQSMQDLAKQPSSIAARTVFTERGQELAAKLSELSSNLTTTSDQLATKLTEKQTSVNDLAKQLATLNGQIGQSVAQGVAPNTLYDQRDMLLDKLSSLVPISVTTDEQGMTRVSVGGADLVNKKNAATFAVNADTGEATIGNTNVKLDSGEIQGILDTRGFTQNGSSTGALVDIKHKIDTLAQSIATQINAIHAGDNARNLDDIAARSKDPNAPLEKLLFFVDKNNPDAPPTSAENMIVNPKIVANANKVAAGQSDSIDNSDNINAMYNLQHTPIDIDGQTTTIGDYYRSIVGQMGTISQEATNQANNATTIVQQVDNARQSISGVSIDEEMTNMIRYQQAYGAAAKYVTAVNDMLDKLINGIR